VRPLKLHLKTTLIVSAVVVAIFSIVAYFYTKQAIAIEHKQYEERALQLATYVADRLAAHASPAATFLDQPSESQAELLQGYGFEVTLMQVYQFHREESGEWTALSSSVDPRSTSPERELMKEQILQLLARDFPPPVLEDHPDGRFSVWALAPIIVNFRGRGEAVVGAVGVQVEVPTSRSLAWKMTRLTIFAMALIVIGIAVTTYLLFKRLVYDPVDALLSGMTRAESGDLSVVVPPRALDEIGLLTVRFNHMVDRLREHADERTAHARQLEERVRDATSELAESNDQLVRKNVELFGIQRQLGQLERLATAGQLAAQFAHEVGTPLNLISGHVQLLRAKETDERTIKRLDTIAAQISRIERIVRGMLDQTRRPTPRLEPLDFGALLGRLFDTIAPTLASKHVGLVADIEPDLPELLGDGDQLQQVFINLVNNSLDAMPDGGTLTVSAHADGSAVRVEFSDTGHGVAEADLPHLFEPLFTTKGPEKGSGLGLAVAQEIVREHGGHIEVASTPGAGTTFTILLPLPPAEDEAGETGDTEVTADEAQ
jgi:two-component system, NtrC family, sensor kinase